MNDLILNILLFAAVAAYFAATVLQFAGAALQKNGLRRTAFILFCGGAVLHTGYLILRGVIAGRLPLANQFEFACGFSWAIAVLCVILHCRMKNVDWVATAAMPASFIVLSYAALLPRQINELMPALRSAWFGLHIGSAVFAYAAFAIAGGLGLRYLVMLKRGAAEDGAGMVQTDFLSYRLICLGFLLLTVVILSGCVWAEQAWSTFWSWDPKETWALITWILYAVYLHQRLRRNWRGKRAALFAALAVVCVAFTFIGVNTLLPGLHSYA